MAIPTVHNELRAMFAGDQADRRAVSARTMTGAELGVRDLQRRQRLEELVADGALVSADDYYYAAFLLQHGTTAAEYRRAHDFAQIAMKGGSRPARWLVAATMDRWLVALGQPQQYGTQYLRIGTHGYAIYAVDPQVSDEERAQYDVPPLGEQLRALTEKNDGWPVPWVQRLNGTLQIIEPEDAPDVGPVHLLIPKAHDHQ